MWKFSREHLKQKIISTFADLLLFLFSAEYFEYFAPDFTLHPDVSTRIENQNSRQVRQYPTLTYNSAGIM